MKRWLRWTLISVVTLVVLMAGFMVQQKAARHADASPDAIAAATSDDEVKVEYGDYITFRPLRTPERLGLIFYPGAYTDVRGYAPTLKPIAAAGYRVIAVPMPFELAILGIERAAEVQAANPDITHWVIMGHSVGGTAAAAYTSRYPGRLDGVVIWDSYPPGFASLAEFQKPVWNIHRARLDGLPPETFARQRHLFPPGSPWVAIPGGNHMNFGSFSGGGYQEDWAAEISQTDQHKLVIAATLQALAAIERGGEKSPPPPLSN
jgi:Alpha/beta hydrolase family